MSAALSLASYRKAQLDGISQRDLLVRLFQGIERFLLAAQSSFRNGRRDTAAESMAKARRILVELCSTLNFEQGGEVAQRLNQLYIFLIGQTFEISLKQDPAMIDTILPIVATLREGWQQVPDALANLSSVPESQQGHTLSLNA